MELVLEDFVPYDESVAWRVHDAFYAERGIAAWTAGDIPYAATNNSGFALQNARLLVELVRELEDAGALGEDELVHVLEVGSGHGAYAFNFMEALAHGCGEDGEEIAGRLRYVLSDYAQRNLDEATAHPGLARFVELGTVVPALFDFRRPSELDIPAEPTPAKGKLAKGSKAKAGAKKAGAKGSPGGAKLVAVFLNYVCCVSPLKVIRRTAADGVLEKCVRLSVQVEEEEDAARIAQELASVGEGEAEVLPRRELLERLEATSGWRAIELADAFPEGSGHGEVAGDALDAVGDEGTINYPYPFLELLRGLRPRMVEGGAFLVSDFGSAEPTDVQGATHDRAPMRYGLSLAHDVDFPVLEAFARREGMGVVRTQGGLLELHTAAIRTAAEVGARFEQAFERTHRRRPMGQELLDLSAAAAASFEGGRHAEAARLYELCLRIAPRSPQVIHRYGQACLAADVQARTTLERLARRLRRGRRLDAARKLEWDTLLAGVYLRLGEGERAVKLLLRSLERAERATTLAALALAYEQLGQRERAYAVHLRALEVEPEGPVASATTARLVRDYLAGDDAPVGWRG